MEYTIFPSKTNLLTESYVLGHLECSYATLLEKFKQPFEGNGRDTDCEWNIMLMNGHPIAIYNYRNGKAYNGREGMPNEEINNWVVGGHYDYDYQAVKEFLEGKVSYTFTSEMTAPNKENLIKRLEGMLEHIKNGQEKSAKSSDYHSWEIVKNNSFPQSENS